MMRIGWTLADLAAQCLEPHERDAVRGDLIETAATGRQALWQILGLVARRQAAHWAEWHPWFALLAVVLPLGILMSHASRWWADSSAMDIALYVRIWEWSYLTYPGWRRDVFEILWSLVLNGAALSAWSWTCGYLLASLSRRTVWVTAIVFALVVCFGTFGTSTVLRASSEKFATHFWGVVFPRLFRAFFVVLPLLWGIHCRRRSIVQPTLRVIGAAAVIVMTVLVAPRLEHSLVMGRGGYPNAGPDRTVGTSDDPRPLWPISLIVLWPTAAILSSTLWRRASASS
jgi:hypothetical protein